MADARLHTDDLLPRVVLPDPGGSAVDLSHQSIAGNSIVLWNVVGLPAASDVDRMAGLLGAFEAVEAQVFAVAAGGDAVIVDALEAAGLPQLIDENRSVANAFGLGDQSGLIVVEPGGCIVLVEVGAEFRGALELCQEKFGATEASQPRAHAPVLVIEKLFDPQTCRALMKMWDAGQKLDNAVAAGPWGLQAPGRQDSRHVPETA
jgi:hypothetical protein